MLVGIGHTYYWAGAAGPAPSVFREGNMSGTTSATRPIQTAGGAVKAAVVFMVLLLMGLLSG